MFLKVHGKMQVFSKIGNPFIRGGLPKSPNNMKTTIRGIFAPKHTPIFYELLSPMFTVCVCVYLLSQQGGLLSSDVRSGWGRHSG